MVVDERRTVADGLGGPADEAVDHLFHALADATRRDILRRCVRGQLSVSRLAETYPMSFAAVQKHVAVLERSGLVTKRRHGREQLVRTEPEGVSRARRALDQLEMAWRGRVDRMTDLLAQVPTQPGANRREDRTDERDERGEGLRPADGHPGRRP